MTNLIQKLNDILEYLVEYHITFEEFILSLKKDREDYRKIIYAENSNKEDRSDSIGKISEIDRALENLDILLGKVKLEDIQEAARTFKPKMDSSI